MIADRQKLTDWKFHVINEKCTDGAIADITCTDGRKVAVVRVCENFFNIDQIGQRHTICHELLHPHFHMLMEAAHSIRSQLSPYVFDIFMDRFISAMEYAVDGIADAFANTHPTPEELRDEDESLTLEEIDLDDLGDSEDEEDEVVAEPSEGSD